jgi:hydrocephalus-inducing protein
MQQRTITFSCICDYLLHKHLTALYTLQQPGPLTSCLCLPPGQQFPMEVTPKQLVIPSMEYRYVTLAFAPRAIQAYNATLEATVEHGTDPKTRSFACEVRGEGTLPTISLQEPAAVDKAGRPWLKFPRVLRGRAHTLTVALKNNGVLPASARVEVAPHPAFRLVERVPV